MKKISILFILAVTLIACRSTKELNAADPKTGIALLSPLDSACYSIGVNYGAGLRESMNTFPGGKANLEALAEGFMNAIQGNPAALLISPEEAQAYIQSYVMNATLKEAEMAKEAEIHFFAENKTKEGVITTESGLQYKILHQGDKALPTIEDNVIVHYTGKLLDGTVFDSSQERGEPLTIGVGQVIRGWTEVLQLMPVGSKYLVWIPAELGYGSQGAGQIRPNSTLVFEVELLDIEK